MKRGLQLAALGVSWALVACRRPDPAPREPPPPAAGERSAGGALAEAKGPSPSDRGRSAVEDTRDPHSFARPDELRVDAMDLAWRVDLAARRLEGRALLSLVRERPGAALYLDTRGLEILSVRQLEPTREGEAGAEAPRPGSVPASDPGWVAASYRLGDADPLLGRPLVIELPDAIRLVEVRYRSSPEATGLQWLEPSQTAGGRHPFLYSQSQAIHARSWIPCQDSPGVRVRFEATVDVPEPLVAVMGAEASAPEPSDPGRRRFRFSMTDPVPPYLIALAVGDLAFAEIDARSGVWADPSLVAAAARELAPTGAMVRAAESLLGPYRWGRFDLLILPPAFPFGGMENPRLTFATPTILAGDGSLLSLVAHELAHSWSGNLATNATWSDLWLNEGFTVYVERRIVERVYGEAQAEMEAILGRQDLEADLAAIEAPGLRRLTPDLRGRDPDDNFTDVPYEKGALLLVALERAYGREAFDVFLRRWFDTHAFRSVRSEDFLAFARSELLSTPPMSGVAPDLEGWLVAEDLPAGAPGWDSEAFARVDEAADALRSGRIGPLDLPWPAWGTHERLRFLRGVGRGLDDAQLAALDGAWGLSTANNSEVAAAWYELAAARGYLPADPAMEAFLLRVGRRKFLVPIYSALLERGDGGARARDLYARARPRYHAITRATLDALLEPPAAAAAVPEQ